MAQCQVVVRAPAREPADDESGEGARLIRRCTPNVFSCLKVERGAECVEVNAIRTRDEGEDATHAISPLNGKDETLDDLTYLHVECCGSLRSGCCGLRHGVGGDADFNSATSGNDPLNECGALRLIHALVGGAPSLNGAISCGHDECNSANNDRTTKDDLRRDRL